MKLCNKVKKLHIREFEGFDLSKMCAIASVNQEILYSKNKFNFFSYLKLIIDELLNDDYEMVYENNHHNILLVYSYELFRADHFRTFLKVAKVANGASLYYPKKLKKKKHNYRQFFLNIPKYLRWIIQMCLNNFSIEDILLSFRVFAVCDRFLMAFNKTICLENYKSVIVYYDVCPTENAVVQFSKKVGITTATLQHGIFTAPCVSPTSRQMTGLELVNSVSDYYLAWNKFTQKQLLDSGIREEHIRIAGILKYIDKKHPDMWNTTEKKVFGILLGTHGECTKQNIQMINIANIISSKLGYKYIVKYHPGSNGDEYTAYINNNYLVKIAKKFQDIKSFCEETRFSIIGNSSVYIDLLYVRYPVYRYRGEFDQYADIIENSFKSADELMYCLENGCKLSDKVFDYLCTVNDVNASYKKIFNELKEGIIDV